MTPASALLAKDVAAAGADGAPMPRHVAIIMDGNGRWAARRGLPRFEGHRRGVEAVRRTVRASIEIGIGTLTIYAFSTENWARPASEVNELLGLLRRFIRNDLADLHARNVRVRIIGERSGVSEDLQKLLAEAETVTRANTGLTLVIGFNYGSRQEIAAAVRRIARLAADGALDPETVDAAMIDRHLATDGLPEPDLLIRTSGEQRLSNFLLWQLAYTEFVFLPVLWPDFDRQHLEEAVAVFRGRDRRFGGVGSAA